ncbi:MAG: proline racemase family protein [Chloroflexota bacterium]
MTEWQPPEHWPRITSIDAHTGGEPLRIITGGVPEIPGETILEKRRYAKAHLDDLRRALMWEPRGHADMYGCLLTEPTIPDGDVGVLFLHNEGFSTMCGHGIIALVKVGVDTGFLQARGSRPEFKIDTPAGRVVATAHLEMDTVKRVSFLNVPSFLLERDLHIDVPGIGAVRCDIAFGGGFYAYVDAGALELDLDPQNATRLIDVGMRIKHAVMDQVDIVHPAGDAALNFLYGAIFVRQFAAGAVHSRNVCIFADGQVDRCPTGTGVSGRLAIHAARGELDINEPIVVESIVGSRFTGEIVETTQVGNLPAVIPQITGTAHITGRNEWLLDPDDPLGEGFFIR